MRAIGVIDYGMGNLHSLAKSLERVAPDRRVEVSYDPQTLLKCDRLVLPGVGGVRGCMNELRRLELNDMVLQAAKKVPLLGICLGMQVLMDYSHENEGVAALGLFPGEVVRFPDPLPGAGERLKVPHMGWNQVHQKRKHPLWSGIPENSWFYFVHSYHAEPKEPKHALGTAVYGQTFTAAIARENLVAVQFHPEKSQAPGIQLLANFVAWNGEAK
jgi:imidazole glycerol-phosphate synthase subunit HisH